MSQKITKAEQTARTRRAILDHTRRLFVSQGYAKTGTQEMIAELGITRGALYHQFGNKEGVFRAVVEEVFIEIAQYIEGQAQQGKTPWEQLVRGSQAYLDIAQREDIQRLLFTEAPAVLDIETLTIFERQYGYGLLLQAIQEVVDAGELEVPNVEGFAMMINGALDQLAFWTIQSDAENHVEIAKGMAERLLMLYRKS